MTPNDCSTRRNGTIVDQVATDCGVLIRGWGAIRKVRFGFDGRGQRGGATVVHLPARSFCEQ
jgi:hypothetical protein